MERLRFKSLRLTAYLEILVDTLLKDKKGSTVIMKACSHRTMGLQDLEPLINKKNFPRKDCILLPLKAANKAIKN